MKKKIHGNNEICLVGEKTQKQFSEEFGTESWLWTATLYTRKLLRLKLFRIVLRDNQRLYKLETIRIGPSQKE